MNIAIIPARGGSKGLPRKNILPIAGKPLITWTIEQALAAHCIQKTVVSTDSSEIADVSEQTGAEIIWRRDDLGGDTVSSESVLKHTLEMVEAQGDSVTNVVFLQCTSPLRDPSSIDEAFEHFESEKADSLLSVTPSHRFFWEERAGTAYPINYDPESRPRRQDMSNLYQENGSIYIFRRAGFEEKMSRLFGKIALFVMPENTAYEIDDETDFKIVEALLKESGV